MAGFPRIAAIGIATSLLVGQALAQRGTDGLRASQLGEPQANLAAVGTGLGARPAGVRPTIMLTGYWPPTNEAVRRFSDDPVQNPAGWIGSNWENRGYDVYSYFPEFTPPNCGSCGQGSGDFEVDYQDTSADWWPIADALEPIAIITFSRGFPGVSWELEMNQYNRSSWIPDYTAPLQPNPAPPETGYPAGGLRESSLPIYPILTAVSLGNPALEPLICFSADGGGFLSEFIAYHGVWYQALHSDPMDPAWCVAAGHVHVGTQVSWGGGQRAAENTLRAVIRHVDSVRFGPGHAEDLYCTPGPNSASSGAMLTASGSSSIAANDMRWLVTYAPPSVNGILFYGNAVTNVPFGNGTLCIAGPQRRVPGVVTTDADGFLEMPIDLSAAPFSSGAGAVGPGAVTHFQFYYRDPTAPGATFNLTNAATTTFQP